MDDDFDDHPDWGRVLVPPGSKIQPVGDPTRWGAGVETLLPQPGAASTVTSNQVLQSATRDGYSRSWALAGTLSLPQPLWRDVLVSGINVSVVLQIQMGVGQVQVLHQIALFRNDLAASGGRNLGGLCVDQNDFFSGGPYDLYVVPSLNASPATTLDYAFSFAAIGALIGSTINIRAIYTTASLGGPFAYFPCRSILNLVLTPFAAGEGL